MHKQPSITFVDYLLRSLEVNDNKFPHWKALDVLAYMPQPISVNAVSRLTHIIESNNPSWSEETLKKSFETLVWIGSEEGIEFISRACNSEIERISNMAGYWVNWLEDDNYD